MLNIGYPAIPMGDKKETTSYFLPPTSLLRRSVTRRILRVAYFERFCAVRCGDSHRVDSTRCARPLALDSMVPEHRFRIKRLPQSCEDDNALPLTLSSPSNSVLDVRRQRQRRRGRDSESINRSTALIAVTHDVSLLGSLEAYKGETERSLDNHRPSFS